MILCTPWTSIRILDGSVFSFMRLALYLWETVQIVSGEGIVGYVARMNDIEKTQIYLLRL